jgi:uncharacterized membrane protein
VRNNTNDATSEWNLAILIGLTLFAFATRSYGIWEWDFRGDEYHTVTRAAERYKSLVNPAYYALVMGSFKFFGVSEWSARLPAMLLGILSVPVFYLTWRSVFGRNAAFVGALLIVFSNWHLYYSQFSRFYTGVFLFGSISYFFYFRAICLDRYSYLSYAIFANIGGILFHVTSIMVTVSCLVFSFIVIISKRALESGYSRRIARTHLALSAVGGLISVSILFKVAKGWAGAAQTWGYGSAGLMLQTIKYFQVPIVVSALLGMFFLLHKDVLKGLFFAVCIGVPFLALLFASALVPPAPPRYIFYVLPLVFGMSAFLCDQVRLNMRNFHLMSHTLTIILIICILPETVSHYTARQSLNSKQAVEFVKNAYQPGDRIRTFKAVYKYYFGNNFSVESDKLGYPLSNNVEWGQKLKPYKGGKGRVWFILDVYRKPLAKGLEAWLMENASLIWRKFEKRYDYNVRGIEIWLIEGSEYKHQG